MQEHVQVGLCCFMALGLAYLDKLVLGCFKSLFEVCCTVNLLVLEGTTSDSQRCTVSVICSNLTKEQKLKCSYLN